MKSNIGLIVNKVYERLRPWHAIEWLWASGDGNVWFVKIGGVAMYVHLQKSGQFEVMECEPYQGGLMPFRKDGNFAWRIEQLLNGAVRDDDGNLRHPSQERGPSPVAKLSAQVAEDMAICQVIIDKFISSTLAPPVVLDASPEAIEKMTAMLREQDQKPLAKMPFRKLFAPYKPMIHSLTSKPRLWWLPEGARILSEYEVITEGDKYWDGVRLDVVHHAVGMTVAEAKQRWNYNWRWCRLEATTPEVTPEVAPEVTPQEAQQDTPQVCGKPDDGWRPVVGDWVRVKKPARDVPGTKCRWLPKMDHLDGAVVRLVRFYGAFAFSTTDSGCEEQWSLEPSWLSKWKPKVGDWVQVKKPSVPSPPNNWTWLDSMDHLDGAIVLLLREDTRFFKNGFRFGYDESKEQRFTLLPEWLSPPPAWRVENQTSEEPSIEIPIVVNESLPEGVFVLASPGGEAVAVSKPAELGKYITPTDEHLGMVVKVRRHDSDEWRQKKLIAVLPDGYVNRFICEDEDADGYWVGWKQARVKVAKPEPEFVFKGEEYRLATEADVGKLCVRSDKGFDYAVECNTKSELVSVNVWTPYPYECADGFGWKHAWVKVSSDGGGA